jgi:hypothetical protein
MHNSIWSYLAYSLQVFLSFVCQIKVQCDVHTHSFAKSDTDWKHTKFHLFRIWSFRFTSPVFWNEVTVAVMRTRSVVQELFKCTGGCFFHQKLISSKKHLICPIVDTTFSRVFNISANRFDIYIFRVSATE